MPDGSVLTSSGSETVRGLGSLWIVGEMAATLPGSDEAMSCVLLLGFDSAEGVFVGSWAGSPLSHLFVYRGSLDYASDTLSLDCTGPSIHDTSKSAAYQDVIQLVGDTTRIHRSRMKHDDGSWHTFMEATYTKQ